MQIASSLNVISYHSCDTSIELILSVFRFCYCNRELILPSHFLCPYRTFLPRRLLQKIHRTLRMARCNLNMPDPKALTAFNRTKPQPHPLNSS